MGLPGSPVVRTPSSHSKGLGSIPGQGIKIPQAALCSRKNKRRALRDREKEIQNSGGSRCGQGGFL